VSLITSTPGTLAWNVLTWRVPFYWRAHGGPHSSADPHVRGASYVHDCQAECCERAIHPAASRPCAMMQGVM
jgi:hypothetical protein